MAQTSAQLSAPQSAKPLESFAGLIMFEISRAVHSQCIAAGDAITIDEHQSNGAHGVHQCRVKLAGDPRAYRLILAPADAPVEMYGRPIGQAFARPLGGA